MTADPRSRFERALDLALSASFVIAIALPLLGVALAPSSFNEFAEGRRAAPPPRFARAKLVELPRQIEAWFSDRFTFRAELIRLANLGKYRLGVSPSPKVLLGRDGWLFYAGERAVEQHRRLAPFSDRELRIWRDRLEARRKWLALRGIHYMLVIPPNKETIYPDALPSELDQRPGSSRLDQLYEELARRTAVKTVDLRDALVEARKRERVYHRTDSHWNERGAFAAYRAIATRLHAWFPAVVSLDRSATREHAHTGSGDLAGLLGLSDDLLETEYLELDVTSPRAVDADPRLPIPPGAPPHARPRACEVNDATLPRAVILRDSFFEALIPFVCEHFRRSVILPSHELDPGLIERERPDVVIEEMLERYLMLGAPANPRAVDQRSPATSSPEALPVGVDDPLLSGISLGPLSAWQATDLDALAEGEWISNGPAPAVEIAVAPFTAEPQQRLQIRLIARPGSEEQRGLRQARLWWNTGTGFSEPLSLPFSILVDARRHVYRVTPSLSPAWRGRVEGFRIQLIPLEPGIRYELGAVELVR